MLLSFDKKIWSLEGADRQSFPFKSCILKNSGKQHLRLVEETSNPSQRRVVWTLRTEHCIRPRSRENQTGATIDHPLINTCHSVLLATLGSYQQTHAFTMDKISLNNGYSHLGFIKVCEHLHVFHRIPALNHRQQTIKQPLEKHKWP